MDTPFTVLLDAPGKPVSRIQIAKLGDKFKDPRYGEFSITADQVGQWSKNLSRLPGGEALVDVDHNANKPGPFKHTEASGWITGVELDNGTPMATVRWTPKGEAEIREGRYKFLSPVFGPYKTEDGETIPHTLQGVSLTNKPFLNMPTVTLARADSILEAGREPVASPDRRPQMKFTADTLKLLGITDEAEVTKILAAADADDFTEVKFLEMVEAARPEDEPTKTLEQLATEGGFKLIKAEDVTQLDQLQGEVTALTAALNHISTEKAAETFESAFRTAEGQGKAAPAQKQTMLSLYEKDPTATLKLLDEAPKAFTVKPAGKNHAGDAHPGDAPEGLHPEHFELEQSVRAYMTEHDETDYLKALNAVTGVRIPGMAA